MESMEEIYRKHARTVYGFLLSKTGDPQTAEELTQETFYQAVRNIGRFRGDSGIATWLCAIAGNVWKGHLKRNCREFLTEEITEPEKMTTLSAEQEYFSKHNHVEIFRLLHKLKEPCREVMYLRLSAELSFREIGEIMGKSENWARVTFYRGKETIRHQMEEGSRDDGEEANRRQRRK